MRSSGLIELNTKGRESKKTFPLNILLDVRFVINILGLTKWNQIALKENIETNFQELKTQETNKSDPLFLPEKQRVLEINLGQDVQSKFLMNKFSYFSNILN